MTTPATPSSPPPSPQAPALHLPVLARMLLWSTRRRQLEPVQGAPPTVATSSTSPPPSPTKQRVKAHHIECSSGVELKTHGRLVDGKPECRQSDVITNQDVFVCSGGVDTARLLLLSRRRVFEKVELLGGNAIIDERWSCTICKQQTRRGPMYKVSIQYQGTPARCALPDPQRPVAADEAKGVPGLMTIVSRQ